MEKNISINEQPPIVMTFSGHDPSGGAGIQADIETLASIGCHCCPIITALTVQDTRNVVELIPVDAAVIIEQARAILEDMPISAFKIGLLGSIEAVQAVHTLINDYPNIPLVLDPIIKAGGGTELTTEAMISATRDLILPLTKIITPNTDELLSLSPSSDNLDASAQDLLMTGCEYVLVTGTHAQTLKVENILYGTRGKIQSYLWERLPHTYHGSGCTLASAISGYLAHKLDIQEAITQAQSFTWQALKHSHRLGMGQLLPNRLHWTIKS